MKSKSKSVQTLVSQLSKGYGAQRLPGALRAIEIQDVPSRGALKGQREFMKVVLPKIRYHNNDQLSITTEWRKMPERRSRTKKEASTSDVSSEAVSPAERANPVIRLHFSKYNRFLIRLYGKRSLDALSYRRLTRSRLVNGRQVW